MNGKANGPAKVRTWAEQEQDAKYARFLRRPCPLLHYDIITRFARQLRHAPASNIGFTIPAVEYGDYASITSTFGHTEPASETIVPSHASSS